MLFYKQCKYLLKVKQYFLICMLFGCVASNKQSLPVFTYNGKLYNQLIENRIPNYGIDGADGCIRKGEISLRLDSHNSDSISGEIADQETKEMLPFTRVIVYFKDEQNPITFYSDNHGKFYLQSSKAISTIQVENIGYRRFKVNLSDLVN